MKSKIDFKFIVGVVLIVLAVASRFLPHTGNFSPIMSIALFSGFLFSDRKVGLLIPIGAMFLSDIVLGLHPIMLAVYASFGIIAILGHKMKSGKVMPVLANSLIGAVIFFVVTNFAVWCEGWYGYTFEGLLNCYTMAIPYFRATLASSVIYSAILFGGLALAARKQVKLITN